MTYRDDHRFAKISSSRLQSAVVQITGKRTSLSLSESDSNSNSKTKATKPKTSRKKKAKVEKDLPSWLTEGLSLFPGPDKYTYKFLFYKSFRAYKQVKVKNFTLNSTLGRQ